MRSLGTLNAWHYGPMTPEKQEKIDAVNKCNAQRHQTTQYNSGGGSCWNTYECKICQITWTVDSSD